MLNNSGTRTADSAASTFFFCKLILIRQQVLAENPLGNPHADIDDKITSSPVANRNHYMTFIVRIVVVVGIDDPLTVNQV